MNIDLLSFPSDATGDDFLHEQRAMRDNVLLQSCLAQGFTNDDIQRLFDLIAAKHVQARPIEIDDDNQCWLIEQLGEDGTPVDPAQCWLLEDWLAYTSL
jgi:hypothetical protein